MITCSRCESENVIKYGHNYFKNYKTQKYRCLNCNKFFCHSDRLPKDHMSSEIVGFCIDLYVKGLSYRVIQQQLKEQYHLKVTHVTIYNNIHKYVHVMKKYIDTLTPNLSAVWQMDETFIPFKGRYGRGKLPNKQIGYWCWDCIDTKTRFVLDMYLGVSKQTKEGEVFFKRIKELNYVEPKVISSDGNVTYQTCIRKYYPQTKHLQIKQISIKPNTSFIERFNGTIKNRTKTMRCFDEYATCQTMLTLFQIYYNFLRPHMSLNDKTPAQAAGIDLELPNRWISLIRTAIVGTNFY